jgi:DNA-binding NtrC family response regulator
MTRVLILELDEDLRGALHQMLTTVGHYAVTTVTTEAAGLELLATSAESVVAVCSNVHADHHLSAAFFAAVVADERVARRHQYILLSTDPARIPEPLRADLSRLQAAIVPKPFDMDALLAAVREAASRLR